MGMPPGSSAAAARRGGYLIREARLRAGLSQSELARRLSTSQSLVARWERGSVSPSYESLVRAIRACGLDLGVGIYAYDSEHDLLIDQRLALPPAGRIRDNNELVERTIRMRDAARRVR